MSSLIPEWLIGIIFQLIGSFFSNLGINVQKYSHLQREQLLPSDPLKTAPYYKTPMWLAGFGLFCLGEVFAGVAMGYSTQSLLAVLSSYSLILNGLFSMALTGTKITANYIKSSLIIMLGSILVILSTTHHKQQYTVEDLGHLFRSLPFLLFFLFLILFLGALFVIRSVIPKNPTLLTTISAFMACLSVLLAKCTMQLVKKSFFDDEGPINQFTLSIWPWVIPCFFAIFAALNVHFMNLALQVSSTTHVYPLYYSTSTILVIINGMLFFQEYLWFSFLQSIIFSMGVSICLTGITSLQEEEQEHQYDILPRDSPLTEEDVFDSVVNAYPPDFFLKQEVAEAHRFDLPSASSSGASEMASVLGRGFAGLGGGFGMTPGSGSGSEYSSYQNSDHFQNGQNTSYQNSLSSGQNSAGYADDGQFFSPKYNMAVSTTSPLPGGATPIPGALNQQRLRVNNRSNNNNNNNNNNDNNNNNNNNIPQNANPIFPQNEHNNNNQNTQTTFPDSDLSTIFSPNHSITTTGLNSAQSHGLWDSLNENDRERLQAEEERRALVESQYPSSSTATTTNTINSAQLSHSFKGLKNQNAIFLEKEGVGGNQNFTSSGQRASNVHGQFIRGVNYQNNPAIGAMTPASTNSIYDEPVINMDYNHLLASKQAKQDKIDADNQRYTHQVQFNQMVKQQVAQPVASNGTKKQPKTRVVRQAGEGSRLTSFFESQSNITSPLSSDLI